MVGGVVLDRTVLDDDEPEQAAGISDAEHDRLIDACVAETEDRPFCTAWMAHVVDTAEANGGEDYRVLAAMLVATLRSSEFSSESARDSRVESACEDLGLPVDVCDAFLAGV